MTLRHRLPAIADLRPAATSRTMHSGGLGRRSTAAAERLSLALRGGVDPLLSGRRRVAALALGCIGTLSVVGLYQIGIIPAVPEPALPGFDADRVDASGEAYALLATPDAFLGIASYAGTLVLAGAGAADRAQRRPWLVMLFAGKVALDALSAAFLTVEQISRHRKLCSWCMASAVLTFAMVPQVVPETRRAADRLLSGGSSW